MKTATVFVSCGGRSEPPSILASSDQLFIHELCIFLLQQPTRNTTCHWRTAKSILLFPVSQRPEPRFPEGGHRYSQDFHYGTAQHT